MPRLQREAVFATILCLFAAAVARPAVAQEIKLAYIDSEKVLQSYKGYKDAETQFEKQSDAWKQELDKRSRELKAMEEDFKAQQLMLSDEKRQEKFAQLDERRRDLEKYYQDVMGPGGEAARKQEELLRPIYDRVSEIIREIGEQEKYTMILDASNTGIAYAASEVDLTDRVIERLNAQ